MDFMNALECTEPGILTLVRRPAPVRGPDEVLVRPITADDLLHAVSCLFVS